MSERTPTFQIQAFGNYYLLERIAVGGMAEIFKAKQVGVRGFEKIVVIKKILHHLSEDPEFVEMFEDEARLAAQLNQANIVQIYELGESEGTLYITMEHVEGKNLRDLTKAVQSRHLHLSIEQVLYIMTEVLKGLDYAHRKMDSKGHPLELVHRDISPQNIIASYEGEVKILDFGIAKAASKISKTEAGVLKGKFSYMSPEQASGRTIDQRTDIFACGVIAHELLTSSRLFREKSDTETLERVKEALVEAPSKKNPLVPTELDAIVFKALAKNPDARYSSAAAFLNDLTRLSVDMAYNYSSKEMSAFLKTVFSATIDDEQRRLQEALARVPDSPSKQLLNARTRVAFKADVSTNGNYPDAQVDMTKSVVKKPGGLRHLHRGILLSGLAAIVLAIALFYTVPSEKSATMMDSPSNLTDPSKEPSDDAQASRSNLNPKSEKSPLSASKAENSKLSLPKILIPSETPKPDIGSILRGVPTQSPTLAETHFPDARPLASLQSEATTTVSPPEPAPRTSTKITSPEPKPPASQPVKKATLNVIAPAEGYAELFIDEQRVGTVPGPKARGIKLSPGTHTIECRSPQRSYKGEIEFTSGQNISLKCDALESNFSTD